MLFFEKLEDVPEQYRDEFVESEFDGKKGFQHKQVVALANTMRNTKAERETEKQRREQMESKLQELETSQAERIRQAREQALEEAKKAGNSDELDRLQKEKMDDAIRRAKDEAKLEFEAELRTQRIGNKRKDRITELTDKYALEDAGSKAAFRRLIEAFIGADDESESLTYLNEDGSASSLDDAGFEKEILNLPILQRLLKADIVTTGGGKASGSSVSSANKKPEDYTEQERVQLFRTNPALFKKLFVK